MYVTLKFDDNGCCRIHSVSDGHKEIVIEIVIGKVCGYALKSGYQA